MLAFSVLSIVIWPSGGAGKGRGAGSGEDIGPPGAWLASRGLEGENAIRRGVWEFSVVVGAEECKPPEAWVLVPCGFWVWRVENVFR